MIYEKRPGVPKYECFEYAEKTKDYVVLIPIINEGDRITKELTRAKEHHISDYADIVICDGGSTDGCTDEKSLRSLDVNTLLVKRDEGKQGAQLRMGISWALERGYEGIITIDGNNKDSIEDVPNFIQKLKESFQGEYLVKYCLSIEKKVSIEEIKEYWKFVILENFSELAPVLLACCF